MESFIFQTNSDNDIAPEITFEKEPPPIEWHIAACNDIERFDILTVRCVLFLDVFGVLPVVQLTAVNSCKVNERFVPY